jgi:arylsulfatase A-like enzyme
MQKKNVPFPAGHASDFSFKPKTIKIMKKIRFGFAVLLAPLALLHAAENKPSKPNVLFILADDLGWRDLGCYGSRFYETPNIDRLAARGLSFSQAYSASPLCSPTRSSIMTGLAPARIGITVPVCHLPEVILESTVSKAAGRYKKSLTVESATRLKPEYFTLAESFKAAGYATAHFGKWHLGAEPYSPLQQGFDVDVPHTPAPGPYTGYLAPWKVWPGEGQTGDHLEDRMAQEAVRFIKAHKDKPFFVNYWAFSVHAPFSAKAKLIEYYRAKKPVPSDKQNCPEYAAMVHSLDDAVGTLIQTLDEEGLWDNTIVVFTSDNGGNMYDVVNGGPPTSNDPLRAGKATYYEGGTRVPCMIHWPGLTKPSTKTDALAMSTDFFPTFCDVLGIVPPPVPFDGHSLATLLRGEAFDRGPLFCHFPHPMGKTSPYAASWVRDGDWKLIRLYQANDDQTDCFELYNLREDIGESRDRSTDEPDRVKALSAKLSHFLEETHAVLPKPNPAYDPSANVEIAGWRPAQQAGMRAEPAHAVLISMGNDPQFVTTLAPPLAGPLRIEIRMKSSSRGDGAVYWTHGSQPYQRERGTFFAPMHDGQWHDYRLELKAVGPVSALRFDPSSAPGDICVESIRLLSAAGAELKAWTFGDTGQAVDFRYALPWWQTAICLPDDPDKTLVGKDGQLLFDFGGGGIRNFGLCLQPEIASGAKWLRQETLSPRVPVVQTWKDADGVEVLEETFVATPEPGTTHLASRSTSEAETRLYPSVPGRALPPRQALVHVTLKNLTATASIRQPQLRIQCVEPVRYLDREGCVMAGAGTRISASEPIESCLATASNIFLLRLAAVTLPPGATRQVAFRVDRHSPAPLAALTVDQVCRLQSAARQWWEEGDLPFDTLTVPDLGIQGMIESSVRNIWQAREIKNGQPAFHVGPTCYRGLWVVDGSFLLETAALLGRGQDARAGIEYLLSHQKPDGSFEILPKFWKENGIVLWAATRHALLTQDKAWLRAHWPALQRVVKAIQNLRAQALADPASLDYRLLPPGDVDGGISNKTKPEFSNTYWCLAGLKAAIAAARWLGDDASATAWQNEFDDFYAAYRKAAARDTLHDPSGNAYVPTMMGNIDQHVPARGQWAFCHAVYPGQIFARDDALVEGQLAMLSATKVQGMVYDTGWMKEGIWTYFASFYGHAQLWQGRGREAAHVLYAFARHACPTRVWREEQKPVGKGDKEVGDMPHNWASAEFIRLTTHLIELDRGDDLHLFEGLPPEWLGAGMVTRLKGVLTPFGPLTLELRVASDGQNAALTVAPLPANNGCRSIVVHLPSGETKPFVPSKGIQWMMPVKR